MSRWLSDFFSWMDDRLGLSEIRTALLDRSAPAASNSRPLFLQAVLLVLLVQFLTGFCLSLYYVPSVDHAHTTVEWIQKDVAGGSFIRSLHRWSASILLLLLILHLIQALWSRRLQDRQEVVWMIDSVLVLLILAFAITGAFLPWDQNAYFSMRAWFGGMKPGSVTLSRSYAIHSTLLPAVVFVWLVLHFLAARKSSAGTGSSLARSSVSVAALTLLMAAASFRPVSLEPIANPLDLQYLPHPDWYLVPLSQVTKLLAGHAGLVPIIFIAGALALVFAIPFIARKRAVAVLFVLILVPGVLVISAKRDEGSPDARGRLGRQEFLAAEQGTRRFVPDQLGSVVPVSRDRIPPVPRQFAACAECHGDLGGGGLIGPDLINVGKKYDSPERLEALLLDPQAYGVAAGQMPRFTDDRMPAYERKALIEYLTGLSRN